MPVCFIEGPSRISPQSCRALVADATKAIHSAYPIPDTRVHVRASDAAFVGQDGAVTFVRICIDTAPA